VLARRILWLLIITMCLWLVVTIPAIAQTKKFNDVELTIPDTTLTLQGYAAPNAIITFSENSSVIGTVSANNNGFYSKTLPAQQTGIRTINQYFTDKEATKSQTITSSFSVASQQNTVVSTYHAPTITLRSDNQIQQGSIVQLSGYTVPNAAVSLQVSSQVSVSVVADAKGFYEFFYNSEILRVGDYFATVTSTTTDATQKSEQSTSINFRIVSSAVPTRPDIVVSPARLPPPIPQNPIDESTIEGNTTTISGESVPNAQINIYENGVLYGSIFADDTGSWSFTYTARFSPVTLSFEACIDGRCSVLSKTIKLFFNGLNTGVCSVVFELERYRYWGVSTGDQINLNVFLSSGDGVLYVDWGDDLVEERFDHDADRPRPYNKDYQKFGDYNGTARFVQGDCEITRYFSVRVRDNNTSDVVWILLPIALFCLYIANRYYRSPKEDDTIVLKDK